MHALESDYLGKMFHQYTGFSSTGSLFPNKLYRMLTDQTCVCMYWGGDGTHLVINTREFEDELLEDTSLRWKYQLKTTSTTSFIRQLHAYGFKKVLEDLEKFGPDPNYIRRYYHPCFQEKRPELLAFMKRNVRASSSSQRKRQLLHQQQQEMQQASSSIHHHDINNLPFIPPQFTPSALMAPNAFYPPPTPDMFMSKEPFPPGTSSSHQQQQTDEEPDSSNSRKNRRKAQPRRHPSFDIRFGQGDCSAMSFPFGFKVNVKSESAGEKSSSSSLLDSVVGNGVAGTSDQAVRLKQDHLSSIHSSPNHLKRPATNHSTSFTDQQPLDLSSPVAKKVALINREVEQKANEKTTATTTNNYKNTEQRRMSCPSPALSPHQTSQLNNSSSPKSTTPPAISCSFSTPFAGNLPPRVQVPYGTMLQPAYIAWTTRKIYSAEHKRWIQARPSIIPLPMKPVAPESCPNFNFHLASNTVSAEKLVENFPHFPVSYSPAVIPSTQQPHTSSPSEKSTIDDSDVTTTATSSLK